jgi:hypothetical protein
LSQSGNSSPKSRNNSSPNAIRFFFAVVISLSAFDVLALRGSALSSLENTPVQFNL